MTYKVTGRYSNPNSHGSVMCVVASRLSRQEAEQAMLAAIQSGAWYDLTISLD